MIKTHCQSCQTPLRLPEGTVGKKVRCPTCKNVFLLTPGAVEREAPAPAPFAPEPAYREPAAHLAPPAARPRPRPARFDEDAAPPVREGDHAPLPQRSGFVTFFGWLLILAVAGGFAAVWFGYAGDLPPVPGKDFKSGVPAKDAPKKDAKP